MSRNVPIRILIIGASNIGRGGRSTAAYNLVANCDSNEYIVDFFCEGEVNPRDDLINNINENCGTVYEEKRFEKNYFLRQIKWLNRLKKVTSEVKYDIVHIHCDNAQEAFRSIIGINMFVRPKIVVHGHTSRFMQNTSKGKKLVSLCTRDIVYKKADARIACSKKAWCFLFGSNKETSEKDYVIKNGIDTGQFIFDPVLRDSVRTELNIEDGVILIGHVGNFYYPKNHKRIVDIFSEYNCVNRDSRLLLVGMGPLFDELQEYAKERGVFDKIIFLGYVEKPSKYYQAMDLFLMPSVFEGVPLAGIEAQCSDLPCVFSDSISQEVKIIEKCVFLSLEEGNNKWSEEIRKLTELKERKNVYDYFVRKGYDIESQRRALFNIYKELV